MILEKQKWQAVAGCAFAPGPESTPPGPPAGEQGLSPDDFEPTVLDLVQRARETLISIDLAAGRVSCGAAPATQERNEQALSDLALPSRPVADWRAGSWLGTPLWAHGQVFGVLSLIRNQPGTFAPQDVQLATVFAGQAAMLLENERLVGAESESRLKLQSIQTIAMALSAGLSSDTLPDEIAAQAAKAFQAEAISLMLWNEDKSALVIRASYGLSPKYVGEQRIPRARAESSLGEDGSGLLYIAELAASPLGDGALVAAEELRSLLTVPLVRQRPESGTKLHPARGNVGRRKSITGALNIYSKGRQRVFEQSEIELAHAFAAQASIAIENARLFAEAQQRVRELTALTQVSQAINRAEGLDKVMSIVLDEVLDLLGSHEGSIILLDPPGGNQLRIVAERGLGQEVVEAFNSRPVYSHEGTYQHALRDRQLIEVSDTSTDPDFLRDVGSQARSLTNVPLLTERGATGLIAVDGVPRDETARRLLLAIAGMAAVAIDRERLHQETANRLAEVSTLYTLATQIASSLSLASVLETIVSVLRMTLDCRSCSIFLLDATTQYLQLEAGSGPSSTWKGIARMRIGEGVSGRAIMERRSIYIPDTRREADFLFFDPQIRSLLVVPLTVRNKPIGTLSIDAVQPNAFDEEVRLLTIAATQAAVAIENVGLYESLQKSYEDLERAYEELRHLDKMKSELIQNVSHELRTPLTFIKGYVELLQDGEMGGLKPEQHAALGIVATKAEGLSRLVDDIISMQQAGREQMQFAPHSLAALGRLATQAAQASAQESDLDLVADIQEVPSIMGDWRRLGQVFDNLIQNAIKFSAPGGRVVVRVRPEELLSSRPQTWVRVEVEDWGIGIPREQQARIWERFYQVDGTSTRRFGGTGLGLAIVKQIVEAHRGFVGVESELQKGSLFYFSIPAIGANREQGG